MSDSRLDWWAPNEGSPATTDVAGMPDDLEPPRRSRSYDRARVAQERRSSRRRAIVAIVVAAVMLLGAGYVVVELLGWTPFGSGGSEGAGQGPTVHDYPGPGRPSALVTINAGDTGASMGATLVAAGVVATQEAFVEAFAANPDAARIQPGTYSLLLEMKASDAVLALLNPAARVSMKVTIPEGYTVKQIITRINEVTGISVDELNAALADTASYGLPAEANGNPEGWLAPSTYQVEPGAAATAVLSQMVQQTISVLSAKGVPQDQWFTVLTKASLIEKEAGRPEDRPPMARAIENRIEQGWTLDIDAAVAYGLGKSGLDLTTDDKLNTDNPYNLYKHRGLPPTPISAPGAASIDAVLAPAEGTWFFWCTVNFETKETRFSTTQAEQDQCVADMKAWLQSNVTPTPSQ